MSTISSEEIMNQLLELERELIELEEKFSESFEKRERDLFEATDRKFHEIESSINKVQNKFLQYEKSNSEKRRKYKSSHPKLDLEPQFQV